jgi:hypothetical protein
MERAKIATEQEAQEVALEIIKAVHEIFDVVDQS